MAWLPLAFAACSATVPPAPKWDQGENAIKLVFHADSDLNYYENQPHSLALSLFQLDEPNAFQQLIAKPGSRPLLLSMSNILPPSLASERFHLMPGETRILTLNRAERAKWIALVAGYFAPEEGNAAVLLEISYTIRKDGLIAGEHAMVPEFKRIIYLGSRGLKVNVLP